MQDYLSCRLPRSMVGVQWSAPQGRLRLCRRAMLILCKFDIFDIQRYSVQSLIRGYRNYDVWGASATPGPNAPTGQSLRIWTFLLQLLIVVIGNLCGTSKQPQASPQGALAAWTAAKFPASQVRNFSDASPSLMASLLRCSSSLVWLSMDMS